MARDITGVNVVRSDGRYQLPGELAEEYQGQHLAAWTDSDGNIILQPVRPDKEGSD